MRAYLEIACQAGENGIIFARYFHIKLINRQRNYFRDKEKQDYGSKRIGI